MAGAILLCVAAACSPWGGAQFLALPEPPLDTQSVFLGVDRGSGLVLFVGPVDEPPSYSVETSELVSMELLYLRESIEDLPLSPGLVTRATGPDPIHLPTAIEQYRFTEGEADLIEWEMAESPSPALLAFEIDGPPCVGFEASGRVDLDTQSTSTRALEPIDPERLLVLQAGVGASDTEAFVVDSERATRVTELTNDGRNFHSAARLRDGVLWLGGDDGIVQATFGATVSVGLVSRIPEDSPPIPEALVTGSVEPSEVVLSLSVGTLPDGTHEAFVATNWNFYRYLDATDTWEHLATSKGTRARPRGSVRIGEGHGLVYFHGSRYAVRYLDGAVVHEEIPVGSQPVVVMDRVPGLGTFISTEGGLIIRSSDLAGPWEVETTIDGGYVRSFLEYEDGFLMGFEGAFALGRFRRARGYCSPQPVDVDQFPSLLVPFGGGVASVASTNPRIAVDPTDVLFFRPSAK